MLKHTIDFKYVVNYINEYTSIMHYLKVLMVIACIQRVQWYQSDTLRNVYVNNLMYQHYFWISNKFHFANWKMIAILIKDRDKFRGMGLCKARIIS